MWSDDSDRIYGTETEYGLYWNNQSEISSRLEDYYDRAAWDKLTCIPHSNTAYFFLFNGGMFKLDNPNYTYGSSLGQRVSAGSPVFCTPEFATPECRSVRNAVLYEKAGERIVSDLFNLDGKVKPPYCIIKHCRGQVYKEASEKLFIKDGTTSSGHHENYSISLPREKFKSLFLRNGSYCGERLISFLVSRIILSGCGWVNESGDNQPTYQISARVAFIENKYELATKEKRAIICTRERQLTNIPNLNRLHLIMGDHLMSENALYLTLGTTGIVLRMLEKQMLEDAPMFVDPVISLGKFNNDPTLKLKQPVFRRHKDTSHMVMSALEIQRYFCEEAKKFLGRAGSSEEERDILEYWSDVLDRLEDDPYQLDGELDWVTKLCLIKASLENQGLGIQILHDPSSPWLSHCASIDFAYHYITSDGIYQKMCGQGLVERLLSDKEIRHAVYNPPADTRAGMRCRLMRLAAKNQARITINDWSCVGRILSDGVKTVLLDDPFDNYESQWENMRELFL